MPGSAEKHLVMSGMHALEKGMSYNLTVRIGKDYLTLENISISPWTDKPVQDFEIGTGVIFLETPGTLTAEAIKSAIGVEDRLTISGPMNGNDVKVLREFMGCKYDTSEPNSICPIHYLDLGGVNIVNGGDAYATDGYDLLFHIPENDVIPGYAFYNLKSESETRVVLPPGLRKIGKNAFFNAGVDFVDLPETLEEIGNYSFKLSRIQEITIPGSVSKVCEGALENCENLRRLEIPEGVQELGFQSVTGLLNLEYLYLPYSLTKMYSQYICIDKLKTLKIMTKPEVLKDKFVDLTIGVSDNKLTGEHIDCDLYLCNERQGEVTEGNTWAGNTWKSITFVDGTTLKK